MAEIPPILKLRKQAQKNIASAQDKIVEEIFKVFGKTAVLHGGTSIWRCYRGNRFSEDIDVYIPKNLDKLNLVFENLEKIGFIIEKKKIGENDHKYHVPANAGLGEIYDFLHQCLGFVSERIAKANEATKLAIAAWRYPNFTTNLSSGLKYRPMRYS